MGDGIGTNDRIYTSKYFITTVFSKQSSHSNVIKTDKMITEYFRKDSKLENNEDMFE